MFSDKKNTYKSNFSIIKNIICFVFVLCISVGACGTTYYWIGGTSGNWNDSANWSTTRGGTSAGAYPTDSDTAIFTGESESIVSISNDISINDLILGTVGSNATTFTIASSKTLNVNNTFIFNDTTNAGPNSELKIEGNGKFNVNTFDPPNSGNTTIKISISENSEMYINGNFFADYYSGSNISVKFIGDGQLYIPACGANLNYGSSCIDYSGLSKNIKPTGSADYYKVTVTGVDSFSDTSSITLTLSRTSGSADVKYLYKAKVFSSGTAFTLDENPILQEGILNVPAGSTPADFSIKASQPIQVGEGFVIKIYAPDGSGILLGTVEYNYEEVIWAGTIDNDWNNPSNWFSGSIPNSNDTVTIPNMCVNYPILTSDIEIGGDLIIESNASINCDSHSISATKITSEGTIKTAGGTIKATGSEINEINRLNINGTTTISGKFKIENLTSDSSITFDDDNEITNFTLGKNDLASSIEVVFEGGSTQRIGTISCIGTSTAGITLKSSDDSKWNVKFSNSPTNDSFKYTVIENSSSLNELNLYADLTSIVDSSLPSSFSTENWFATKYYWIGKNSSSWLNASGENWALKDDGTYLLPSDIYPSLLSGVVDIVLSDSSQNELSLSDISDDVKINSLSVGQSSSSNSTIHLFDNDVICSESDTTKQLLNYGKIVFSGTGRIKNSTNPIMDNQKGTVEYDLSSSSENITNYHSDDSINDYYKLVMKNGTLDINSNIRIAKDFIIEKDALLNIKGTTESSFYSESLVLKSKINSEKDFTIYSPIYVNDDSSLVATGKDIVIKGIVTKSSDDKKNFSIEAENVTFEKNIENIKELTIDASVKNTTPLIVDVDSETAYFKKGFSVKTDLSIKGNVEIYGDNKFSKLTIDNSSSTSVSSVLFESDKTQTIDSISVKGNATNRITLGSTGSTDSEKWKVYFTTNPNVADFSYVDIKNSLSVNSSGDNNELNFIPSIETLMDSLPNLPSAFAWFTHKYYWLGKTDSSWATATNWFYDEAGTLGAPSPNISDGLSEIIIYDNSPSILKLENDLTSIKSMTIKESKIVDFVSYSVYAIDTTTGIDNFGTIKINSSDSQTLTNQKNEENSTIEYYGLNKKLAWGNSYENIKFIDGSSTENTGIDDVFSVNKNAIFENGTANAIVLNGANSFNEISLENAGNISLNGENSFAKEIKIISANDVVLNSNAQITLSNNALCNSIDVKCPAKISNITTTQTQTYEKTVDLTEDASFTATTVFFYDDVNAVTNFTINGKTSFIKNSTQNVSSNGNQTYRDDVTFGNEVVFNANNLSDFGLITFGKDILGDNAAQLNADVLFDNESNVVLSKIDFKGKNVSAYSNIKFTLSDKAIFEDSASFSQDTTKNFEITSGIIEVGKNVFDCGNLVIAAGSSFIQTKYNSSDETSGGTEYLQSVSSILNDGVCIWDSSSDGGTLALNGAITGTNAQNVVFNKKNVSIESDLSLSGVFFDLTIPSGKTITNESGIVVRRNFLNEGNFIHNDKTLTFGGISINSTAYPSESIAEISSTNDSTNFGDVLINGLGITNATKTFKTNFIANTIDISPIEKINFGTSELSSLSFKSINGFEIPCPIELISNTTIETPSIKILSTIKGLSKNLTLNVTTSVQIDGIIGESESKIGDIISSKNTCSNVFNEKVYCADINIKGNSVFNGIVTSSKIEIEGNNEFGEDVVSSSITIKGKNDFTKSTAQSIFSVSNQKYYGDITSNETSIIANDSTSSIEFFSLNYTANNTQRISAPKGIFVYLDSDKQWSGNFDFKNDLGIFGSKYDCDDKRFEGSDTRFEMFGFGSYMPSGSSSKLSGSSCVFKAQSNFYANGLDIDDITLQIPSNTESNPIFNSTSAVTENQWGIPYAVTFNATLSNVVVEPVETTSTETYLIASTDGQNCVDGGNNTNVQFEIPRIVKAYSVYDDVICIEFNLPIENSHDEIRTNIKAISSSLKNGGIWYNDKTVKLDENVYTNADCTNLLSSTEDLVGIGTDNPKIYIKTQNEKWNTDADGKKAFNSNGTNTTDSTDRNGNHHDVKIDLSMIEGTFTCANGHTMNQNYGIGFENGINALSYTQTEDYCSPVLIATYVGQERHFENTENQKDYDAHNFIEYVYSEIVDIGTMKAFPSADEKTTNIQTTKYDATNSLFGGEISNLNNGISVAGFSTISKGELTCGIKELNGDKWTGKIDKEKPHTFYRTFSTTSYISDEKHQTHRIRISIAGYFDEDNPIIVNGKSYRNYLGYIETSKTPEETVYSLENAFIKDVSLDNSGNRINNKIDSYNSSQTTQNHKLSSININEKYPSSSILDFELYGEWDTSHPTFAIYTTSVDEGETSWIGGDTPERQYELIGSAESATNPYLEKIEFHLFDNTHSYKTSDRYKWLSRTGWIRGNTRDSVVYKAPERMGGSREFTVENEGGIRRSSLDKATNVFSYRIDSATGLSDEKSFDEKTIEQQTKSGLFSYVDTENPSNNLLTETKDDGLYLSISLNANDLVTLPRRTTFVVTFTPGDASSPKSFITDLAGNRLYQTDDGRTKTLHTVDITPPDFSVTLSPIGTDKIYAVFTKPLAYNLRKLTKLSQSELNIALNGIKENVELVKRASTVDGATIEDATPFKSVEVFSETDDCSALIFTLDNRKITLDDIENLWIRVNENVSDVKDWSGGYTSYIQDINGNGIVSKACHTLSDFAVNAVNVLYAYADEKKTSEDDSDNWNEQGIYGSDVWSESSDYAVHEFDADNANYGKLVTGRDITLQVQFVGGEDENGYFAPKNNETFRLIPDLKKNIKPQWISDKYNKLTNSSWRIWLNSELDAFSTSYNKNPLVSPTIESVGDEKGLLWNFHFENDVYKFEDGDEYQFIFKIQKDGKDITLNHDGDDTTPEVPLYALWMPKSRIKANDYSFLDLWSFTLKSLKNQRGGVTILNNVINASVKEQTVVKVDMQTSGNLNVYVLTLDGNIIKRLSKGKVSEGTHYFKWDGTNNAGKAVARGMYFVRVTGNGIDETRKVMVVKD